jgi:hypothetical protein
VPPIYQPEVAAEAVYWAAHHRRREVYVGASSVMVILGNKVAPSLADRYLARTGYGSQQTGDPVDPDRPDNLFEPADEEGPWRARHLRPAGTREESSAVGHEAPRAAGTSGDRGRGRGLRRLSQGKTKLNIGRKR